MPAIHADLNGLFALAIAAGYLLPYRDPVRYRGYLWIMGPVLKGAGAVLFVADHLLRGSPASFLLFGAADGALALVTLWATARHAKTVTPRSAAGPVRGVSICPRVTFACPPGGQMETPASRAIPQSRVPSPEPRAPNPACLAEAGRRTSRRRRKPRTQSCLMVRLKMK